MAHLFYPRLCEGCNKPLLAGEKVLCISCGLELPETGYSNIDNNETALRFSGRVPFLHATSLAYFTNDGLLQHLMHGLKYKGRKEIGEYLGGRLAESLQQTPWAASLDMVIPVPLYKSKKNKRGYNQSMLIAEAVARALHIPATDDLLLRIRDTETQTKKTRVERVNNMADAFVIKDRRKLAGKHILLVDDVLTTGATLEACALALMKEESIKISIATIGVAI